MNAQELASEIGMSVEAAQRALDGAAMMSTPFAAEIQQVIGSVYYRWLGEAQAGRVEIYAHYPSLDTILEKLRASGYEFGASLWDGDGMCIVVFKKDLEG